MKALSRGWSFTPLNGKIPRLKGWTRRPNSKLEEVRRWSRGGNLGLRTGRISGVLVIDLDPAKGGRLPNLPPTVTVETGNSGWHHYFQAPDPCPGNSSGKLGPGVDVRGEGGVVVYPGSTHPETGRIYRWAEGLNPDKMELAVLPEWVRELLTGDPYATKALARELGNLQNAREGERNDTLNRAAFSLGHFVRDGNLNKRTVESLLINAALVAGLSEPESWTTVQSGLEGGMKKLTGKNSAYSVESAWEPPVPFAEFNLPAFPTDVLPSSLRERVEAEADFTQTPPALAAMIGLSVVATVIQKKVEVQTKQGHAEPTNLYTVTTARPGDRKSPVVDAMRAPLQRFEKEEGERLASEIAQKRSEFRMKEKVRDNAERKAAESGEEKDWNRAIQLSQELEEMIIPCQLRLLADDITPERVSTLLYEQEGRLGILSAEGEIFELAAGRYSRTGPNIGVFLIAHSGRDSLRVDRIGGTSVFVENPALTIGLAVQPEVLRGLTDHRGFRGRGLLARFLYSLPKSLLGSRNTNPPPVPHSVRENYEQDILALLRLSFGTNEREERVPHSLSMSPEAKDLFSQFEARIEPQLGSLGELGTIDDWGGKLVGAVARIAGILHTYKYARDLAPWETPIGEETMRNSIRVGNYLIPHAKAAFALMEADPAVANAKYVLAWIQKAGCTHFSKRDAFSGTRGRFHRVKDLEPALNLLGEYGYIRPGLQPERGGPGRKPSLVYEVNPFTQNSHITQNS